MSKILVRDSVSRAATPVVTTRSQADREIVAVASGGEWRNFARRGR